MARPALLLGLLATCAAVCSATVVEVPYVISTGSVGSAQAANCTSTQGDSGSSWVEMTDIGASPYLQYKNAAGQNTSGLPNPLPLPYMLTATDAQAPGWINTCISRSPSAPTNCTGNACNVYIEEWNVSWIEFATLECAQSYPTPNITNFFTNPTPPPGNVSVTVTNTCKNYFYGPTGNIGAFFFQITDEWGNEWALQTSPQHNLTTQQDWANMLAGVVLPPGWSKPVAVNLTANVTHVPWVVGDQCIWLVMKDNLFNSWHPLTYPKDGPLSTQGIMGQMKTCPPLDKAFTLKNLPAMAAGMAPAPAPSSSSSGTVAKASSGAAVGAAPGLAVLMMAAAGVLLLA